MQWASSYIFIDYKVAISYNRRHHIKTLPALQVPSGIMTTEQNRTLNYDVFICSRERCYKYGELYLEQPTMEGQEHKLLSK